MKPFSATHAAGPHQLTGFALPRRMAPRSRRRCRARGAENGDNPARLISRPGPRESCPNDSGQESAAAVHEVDQQVPGKRESCPTAPGKTQRRPSGQLPVAGNRRCPNGQDAEGVGTSPTWTATKCSPPAGKGAPARAPCPGWANAMALSSAGRRRARRLLWSPAPGRTATRRSRSQRFPFGRAASKREPSAYLAPLCNSGLYSSGCEYDTVARTLARACDQGPAGRRDRRGVDHQPADPAWLILLGWLPGSHLRRCEEGTFRLRDVQVGVGAPFLLASREGPGCAAPVPAALRR